LPTAAVDEEHGLRQPTFTNGISPSPGGSRKSRASFMQRTSQFIHNSADTFRKTKFPSFHVFRQIDHEDHHKVPLKDRLTFKFAKNATKRQTTFHFQDRNYSRTSAVGTACNSRVASRASSIVAPAVRKESAAKLPSELANVDIKDDEDLDDEDKLTAVNSYPTNVSGKHSFMNEQEKSSHSSDPPNTGSSFSNCLSNIRFCSSSSATKVSPDLSKLSVHQNQLEELEKFKMTAHTVEHEFSSIFLFKNPLYYIR
jgi:hypothetical protein